MHHVIVRSPSRGRTECPGREASPDMLPVLSDLQALLRRLASNEHAGVRELASLENRVRRFEDVERPAYERWRRLTFGPSLSSLQELYDQVHARRALAQRVMELAERRNLHPREALYVATHGVSAEAQERAGRDPDVVEARRRAKRERKRNDLCAPRAIFGLIVRE